jgi:hypothetical protein
MPAVSRTIHSNKDVKAEITEIKDGIYRISGFSEEFGITFNQFLINDEKPTLIHTGPIGMYEEVEKRSKK